MKKKPSISNITLLEDTPHNPIFFSKAKLEKYILNIITKNHQKFFESTVD